MKRLLAAPLSFALVLAGIVPPAQAQSQAQAQGQSALTQIELSSSRAPGFSIPLSVTSPDQGTFTGNLRILRFAASQGQIVAVGLVTGSLVDETGAITGIVRTVTLPLRRNTAPAAA